MFVDALLASSPSVLDLELSMDLNDTDLIQSPKVSTTNCPLQQHQQHMSLLQQLSPLQQQTVHNSQHHQQHSNGMVSEHVYSLNAEENFNPNVHYTKNINKEKSITSFSQRNSSSKNVYYPPSSPIVLETVHHLPTSETNNFYLHSPSSTVSQTVSPSHVVRNLSPFFEGNSPDQAENRCFSYNNHNNQSYSSFDVLMSTQSPISNHSTINNQSDYFDYPDPNPLVIDEESDVSNDDTFNEWMEKTLSDVLLCNY